MPLAHKNLLAEGTRLLISVIGVAFAVILILVMIGVFVGTINQVTTYIDHTPNELWVMQDGVTQMFRSVSVLPQSMETRLKRVPGVKHVISILGVPNSFEHQGSQTAFYLLGYDGDEPIGGPWRIQEGSAVLGEDETILDRVLARKNDIKVGDTVELIGEPFKVVGLSDETAAVGNFYAFVRMKDAIKLLDSTGKVSYCLIIAEPGVDIKALQQRIRDRIADIEVYTREEFSENSRGIVVSMMGRPLYVMIAISFLVGVAIVALTIFSITTEQLRDFGVIKAIGGTNGQVYRVVMRQALMLGVAGYILGAIIAYGVQFIIRERLGDVNVQISPTLLAFAFLLTLGMSIFASIVSVRRIANVDPAIVFRT